MKNKKLLLSLIAFAAVIVLMLGVYFGTRPAAVEGTKTITVEVVHKDSSQKDFTYHTDEEYLGPVLVSENLVVGETSEYGLMISAVDGETADWSVDQSYWALYIGEEYAMTGVDTTPIHDGDVFRLVYTIG